jgi:predicted nucleic acid-binding protein
MNVVDSSGWLEYFADEENAEFFAPILENPEDLLVPTLSLFEVFKRVYQQRGEKEAFETIALMLQGQLIDLDSSLAIGAAKLSVELKLPLADSIMLATARANNAQFWTQDADFAGLPGVHYIVK